MSRYIALCAALMIGALSLSAAPARAADSATIAAGAGGTAITITAEPNYTFAPGEITVKVGEPVTLKFVSGGGVHGVVSSDLGIPSTTITPGGGKTVTFTPQKAGTYQLHCTIPCGPGHADMVLTVKVTA